MIEFGESIGFHKSTDTGVKRERLGMQQEAPKAGEFVPECQEVILPLRKQEDTIIHHKLSKRDPKSCKEAWKILELLSSRRKEILNRYLDMIQKMPASAILEKERGWLQSQLQVEDIIRASSVQSWKRICGSPFS